MVALRILAYALCLADAATPLADCAVASQQGADDCSETAQHFSLLQTKASLRSGGGRSVEDAPTGFSQFAEHDVFASSYERPDDAPMDLGEFVERTAAAGSFARQQRETQLLEHAPRSLARRATRRKQRREAQPPGHAPRAHARRAAAQKRQKLLQQLHELEKQKAQLEEAKTEGAPAGEAERGREEKNGGEALKKRRHNDRSGPAELHGHQAHDYVRQAGRTCGECGSDNNLALGTSGWDNDHATPEKAETICGKVCSQHSECAGFVFSTIKQRCFYRSDTTCNVGVDPGSDCFTKAHRRMFAADAVSDEEEDKEDGDAIKDEDGGGLAEGVSKKNRKAKGKAARAKGNALKHRETKEKRNRKKAKFQSGRGDARLSASKADLNTDKTAQAKESELEQRETKEKRNQTEAKFQSGRGDARLSTSKAELNRSKDELSAAKVQMNTTKTGDNKRTSSSMHKNKHGRETEKVASHVAGTEKRLERRAPAARRQAREGKKGAGSSVRHIPIGEQAELNTSKVDSGTAKAQSNSTKHGDNKKKGSNTHKKEHDHKSGKAGDHMAGSIGDLKANSTRRTEKKEKQHVSVTRRLKGKGKNSSSSVRHIPIGERAVLKEQESGGRKRSGSRKARDSTGSAKRRANAASGRRNSSSVEQANSITKEPKSAPTTNQSAHKHLHASKKRDARKQDGEAATTGVEVSSASSWAHELDLAVLGSIFEDGEEPGLQGGGPSELATDPHATVYLMGKMGSDTCPDGYSAITTGAEALTAAKSFGADLNANFVVNDRNNMPQGCFKDPAGTFYFNTRTEETTVEVQGTPVCKILPQVSLGASRGLTNENVTRQLQRAGLNVTGDYYLIGAGDRYLTSQDGRTAVAWTAGSLAEFGPQPKTLRWRLTAVSGGPGTYILGNVGHRGFLAALDGRIGVVPPPEVQSGAEPLAWRLEQLPGSSNMVYFRGEAGAGEYLVTQADGLAIPWGGVAASQAATPPESARWRLVKADTSGDGGDGACVAYMATSGCSWTSTWSCPGQSLGAQGAAQFMGGVDPQGYHCCCELQHYADELPETSLWSFPDAPVSTMPVGGQAGATVDLGFAQDHVGAVHNLSVSQTNGDATNKTELSEDGDLEALMKRVAVLEGLKSGTGVSEESLGDHEDEGENIGALTKHVADLELAAGSAVSAHHGNETLSVGKTKKQAVGTGSESLRKGKASKAKAKKEEMKNKGTKDDQLEKESSTRRSANKFSEKDGNMLNSLLSVSQELNSMRDAFESSFNASVASGL